MRVIRWKYVLVFILLLLYVVVNGPVGYSVEEHTHIDSTCVSCNTFKYTHNLDETAVIEDLSEYIYVGDIDIQNSFITNSINRNSSCQHKWGKGYEARHPHKEYLKCSKCGFADYTGKTVSLNDCTNCTPGHVHSWWKGYEQRHPHKIYMQCSSCNKAKYTGGTKRIAGCTSCNPQVHSHDFRQEKESSHPHYTYFICKGCGTRKSSSNRNYVKECTTCNPVCKHKNWSTSYDSNHPHDVYRKCNNCDLIEYTNTHMNVLSCNECRPSCSHSSTRYEYESKHPHNKYSICNNCGEKRSKSEIVKIKGCVECYPPCQHENSEIGVEENHPHNEYKTCKSCNHTEYTGNKRYQGNCSTCKNSNLTLLWPVPKCYRITSPFGKRTVPYTGFHNGIDVGASRPGICGDEIIASTNGRVIVSSWVKGYGNVIYLNSEHQICGKYIQTRYGHLQGMSKQAGDYPSKGSVIGYMGNTGVSTGAHLHYETRQADTKPTASNKTSKAVDPLAYYFKNEPKINYSSSAKTNIVDIAEEGFIVNSMIYSLEEIVALTPGQRQNLGISDVEYANTINSLSFEKQKSLGLRSSVPSSSDDNGSIPLPVDPVDRPSGNIM